MSASKGKDVGHLSVKARGHLSVKGGGHLSSQAVSTTLKKRLSCGCTYSSKHFSVFHLALILNDILRTGYKPRSLPVQTLLSIPALTSFFQSFNLFFLEDNLFRR